jgi:hypothetical protein
LSNHNLNKPQLTSHHVQLLLFRKKEKMLQDLVGDLVPKNKAWGMLSALENVQGRQKLTSASLQRSQGEH